MRILAIGDIVGERAVEKLTNKLPEISQENNIDFIIANGENSANGNGLTKELFDKIVTAGVDVVTINSTFG